MAMCTPEGGLEPLFGAAEVLDVGMGSYGMVFKAKWRQLPCAVKSLHHTMFSTSDSGTSKLVARFKQECELISMIKHPYIIQFMGSVIDTVSQQPTVLIELMDESLTRFLEWSTDSLPYHTQLNFCDDMALALAYLHSNDIIHRDLSSNNLLLVGEGSRAKIANFDMSKLEGMNPRMSTGMVAYMPPEAFITPPEVFITPPCYPNKLDLWSFGVLVMQIATRQFPNPTDATTTVEDPPTGIMYMLVPERERCKGIELVDTNHPLLPLILQCLKDRGKERPSANELFGRLATLKSEPSYASLLLQALQQENETKASKLERFRANEMELTARLGECEEELKAKGHTVEQQAALRADCENNQPAIKQLHKQLESETAEHEATITQLLEQLHQEFSARQEQLMSELKSQRESAIKQVIAHENSLPELEFLTECMEIKWETGIEENKAKMKHDSLQSFTITSDPVDTLHSPNIKFKHKGKRPSMVYDPVGVTITSNGDPDMYSPIYVMGFPWTSRKDLEIVITCSTILIRATRRETFFCTSETSSEISMFRKAEKGLARKNIRLRPLLLLYDAYTSEYSLFEPPLLQDVFLQDTAALLIALPYLSARDYICYRDMVLFSISLCLVLQCVQLVLHLNVLLLLAGDIETNPGPVESTSRAEYQDLVTIPNIDHKWKQIGIALGIDSPSLNAIAAKNLPPARSKREMFRLVTKKGATWRDLIIALSDVGLKSVIADVSSMYEISLNGLSRYVNSDSASKELPIVHADSATALPTKEIKSASASNEFKTFQSMYEDFLAEFSLNPIMVANAVYSKGIITQEDLHALRVIATNEGKAKQLVSLVEKTISEHPFKFDSFVGALRSVSTHVVMAERILSLYRFNLIWSKVKKVSESELDLNHLSAELNNSQLITDAIRLKAASAANGVEMCALFLTELQSKNLAKPFLDMLDSFPNTKLIASMLHMSLSTIPHGPPTPDATGRNLSSAYAIQGYLSQLPVSAFPYLNLQLDWDNEYDYDLIEIAKHLLNWEILLATPFKFTPADIRDIKAANQSSSELQRRDVLHKWQDKFGLDATYKCLLEILAMSQHTEGAKGLCEVLKRRGKRRGLDLTVSGDPVTTKTTPVALTHSAVRNFLKLLHNTQLRELGLELGLRWPRLKKMKEDCILDDMLDSWLREDDDVAVVSGHPSWQSLVKALEESGYTGVAAAIRQVSDLSKIPFTEANLLHRIIQVSNHHSLGVKLGITLHKLAEIEQHPVEDRKQLLVSAFFRTVPNAHHNWEWVYKEVEVEAYRDSLPSSSSVKAYRDNIEKHMKESGKVQRRIGNLVFIGLPDSGKTTLIANLLNLPINIECSPSTNVMNGIITVDLSKDIATLNAAHISDDDGWTEIQFQLSCLRQMGVTCFLTTDTTASSNDHHPRGQGTKENSEQPGPDNLAMPQPKRPRIGQQARSSKPAGMPELVNPLEIVDKLLEENKREDILLFLDNKTSLYLSDTGGQIEFQELLALLVSPNSVFLFLFALDKGLNEKVEVSFRGKDGETNRYTSTTVEESFMKTLSSIDSMETVVDEQSESIQKPYVFVVGTHRDVLEKKLGPDGATARIAELNKKLFDLIQKHKYDDRVVMADGDKGEVMFAVDNTRPGDDAFRRIRSKVKSFFEDRKEFNIKFPLSYLLASLELQQFEDPFVERTAFSQAIAKYGIEEDDIDHLLHFLQTKIGLIRYFPIKELKRVIMRTPQVLYDLVSELLILSFRTATGKVFSDLQKGIYSREDLQDRFAAIFAAIPDSDLITLDMVILLLKELRIMAPFYDHESKGDKFFVPCCINHLDQSPEYSDRSDVQSLAIRFDCGHCPKGMFGVLIHCLLTQEKSDETMEWVLDKSLIFRDEVSFKVGLYGDIITLKSLSKHVELSCRPTPQPERDSKFHLKVVCHKVRTAVVSAISQAMATLHYDMEKTRHSLALVGACGSESCNAELHVIKQIDDHEFTKCTGPLLPLTQSGAFWFASVPVYIIEDPQINVIEGNQAKVQFQVTQDPPLLKDGGHILSKEDVQVHDTRITIAENVVRFSSIHRGDAGKYSITSSNGIGQGKAIFTLCFSAIGYEFENDYVEAKAGESPTLNFSVISNPPLASGTKHIITKDANRKIVRRFKVQDNCIKFCNVKTTDTGSYTISCCEEFKATFELEISESPGHLVSPTPQVSQPVTLQCSTRQSQGRVLKQEDLGWICEKLGPYSYKWRRIALGLRFTNPEIKCIEAAPGLSSNDPFSYLQAMLSSWLCWAPSDSRGSRGYATLESLRTAVDKAGFGTVARELAPIESLRRGVDNAEL